MVILLMIHLLAASIWVGSMIFFALVVIPVLRHSSMDSEQRKTMIKAIGFRYRILGWATVGVLLTTGPILAGIRGVDWHSTFGKVLFFKLVLVSVMLVLLLLHDLVLSRTLDAPAGLHGRERYWANLLARINLLIVVIILFCGLWLMRV